MPCGVADGPLTGDVEAEEVLVARDLLLLLLLLFCVNIEIIFTT